MTENEEKYEILPADKRADMLATQNSMLFNVALFEHAQRVAQMYAKSNMVPEHFRDNIGNCFVALNFAQRLKADEFMVMQNIYTVHGRPGIEAKLVIALVNSSQKYKHPGLHYEERGNVFKPNKESDGMRAFGFDAITGDRVNGPWVTWDTVKAEGWYDKKGPDGTVRSNKWRTMPEQMFTYRAASWFANKNCPEIKFGMHTTDELQDSIDLRQKPNGTYSISEENPGKAADDLEKRILKDGDQDQKPADQHEKELPWYHKDNWNLLRTTGLKKWLDKNADRMNEVPEGIRAELEEKRDRVLATPKPSEPPKDELPPSEVVYDPNDKDKDRQPDPETEPETESKSSDFEAEEKEAALKSLVMGYNSGQIQSAQAELQFAIGSNRLGSLSLDALIILEKKLEERFGPPR